MKPKLVTGNSNNTQIITADMLGGARASAVPPVSPGLELFKQGFELVKPYVPQLIETVIQTLQVKNQQITTATTAQEQPTKPGSLVYMNQNDMQGWL